MFDTCLLDFCNRHIDEWSSNELEKEGVKLKATSAMLKGGGSASANLFRRGSRRLSTDGVDDALLSKHSDDVKKANHLRKKLKAHHDEASTVLAKKLQVESARWVSFYFPNHARQNREEV